MRSIFWIGCILAVLVSLLSAGAFAESVNSSTVEAAVVQVENITGVENVTESVGQVAATVGAVAEKAENVTGVATKAIATATEVTGEVANVTAPVVKTNVTNGTEKLAAEPDLVNDTLVKFVTDARAFAVNNGKTIALSTFNNPVGGFVNDKMYIFAYDFDGKALAQPYSLGSVGLNQISLADSKGFRYVQQMRDIAKRGVGFVKYQDANLMNKGVVSEKVSYVTNVDGSYWIGAGVYQNKEVKPVTAVTAVKELVTAATDANATVSAENITADVKTVVETAKNVTAKVTA